MILRAAKSLLHRFAVLRAQDGPYRFLVGKWSEIHDLDLAARVLATEFFRPGLRPIPLPVDQLDSVLLLAPHQDDEAIGAGGTLARAASGGAEVHVAFVTDGALARLPDGRGGHLTPEDSVRVRDEEARTACGVPGARVHRLAISNLAPDPSLADLEELGILLGEVRPEVLMVPWLLDSPAKHRLVNHLLWLLDRLSPLPELEVWGFQVHNVLYPNGFVEITDFVDEKRRMLEAYVSQNTYLDSYNHLSMGMAQWNARYLPREENLRPRWAEVFFALPVREHLDLVERFYFTDLEATYRGRQEVIAPVRRLHEEVVGGGGTRSPRGEGRSREFGRPAPGTIAAANAEGASA